MQSVLLTGVTSFTGCHIARAFVDAGWDVTATLTKHVTLYQEPAVAERLRHSRVQRFLEGARFGDDAFLKAITTLRPAVLINHGANIKGYRQPDFDIDACIEESTHHLELLCLRLKDVGGRIIHTGSI